MDNKDAEKAAPPKLDYSITDCEGRTALVAEIVDSMPPQALTKRYLELLGDYIMEAAIKEEKKEKRILTENRLITIGRRETSYEGLVDRFENGEDGLYNLIDENNKNTLLSPRIGITEHDLETIPGLREAKENVAVLEQLCAQATGRDKFILKKAVIDARKDQYALKTASATQIHPKGTVSFGKARIDLSERRWLDEEEEPQSDGLVSFFYPNHISALLANYADLWYETRNKYDSDLYYILNDFNSLLLRAVKDNEIYKVIIGWKIRGKTNAQISVKLQTKFGIFYSPEYISTIWKVKIPKQVAQLAKEEFVIWYYSEVKHGYFKQCTGCGERKPAHHYFFSKNNSSKDGWYCLCKKCRNERARMRKENKKK